MYCGDRKIGKRELDRFESDIRNSGLSDPVIGLFTGEPQLAEMMGQTWADIDQVLNHLGLTPSQKAAVSQMITAHTMKPLILLDRAHRQLWADLLPEEPNLGENHV